MPMKMMSFRAVSAVILLSLSWVVQEENLSARILEGAPSRVVNGKAKMPRDFTQKASKALTARLRLPIMLVPYKKIVLPNKVGKNQVNYVPKKQIVQTLRARLDRANHFYFDGYHIETRPVKWDKIRNQYEMDLTISQTFGVNQQIEEKIGRLRLVGELLDGPDLFRFDTKAKRRFKNKLGFTMLDMQVGWPSQQRISRANGTPPAIQQKQSSSAKPRIRTEVKSEKAPPQIDKNQEKPAKRGWSQG